MDLHSKPTSYWDEVIGKKLATEEIHCVKLEEITRIHEHKVYSTCLKQSRKYDSITHYERVDRPIARCEKTWTTANTVLWCSKKGQTKTWKLLCLRTQQHACTTGAFSRLRSAKPVWRNHPCCTPTKSTQESAQIRKI